MKSATLFLKESQVYYWFLLACGLPALGESLKEICHSGILYPYLYAYDMLCLLITVLILSFQSFNNLRQIITVSQDDDEIKQQIRKVNVTGIILA